MDWLYRNTNWLALYCHSGFRECFRFHRPEHLKDQPIDFVAYLQIYCAKLLLEVCGAAGAVWGASEVIGWRNVDNNDAIWRPMAWGTFAVFFTRFWWHSKHYLERARDFPPIKLEHRREHVLPFVQIFASKWVLEVCGAAGAIWGSSEVLTLRNGHTVEDWRLASNFVGCVFGIRWIGHIFLYCLCVKQSWLDRQSPMVVTILQKILGWLEIMVTKFILEVLGAAGAVWGFSEIMKLRVPSTIYIWRPVALGVGLVFACRWVLQVFAFAFVPAETPPEPPKETKLDFGDSEEKKEEGFEVENLEGDLEISDLAFVETIDFD